MPADLPAKINFTGSAVTEGGFKTEFDTMIDFLNETTGGKQGYLKLSNGATASRPAALEGGWLRWNTDRTELEMSYGTTWQQMIRSTVDATWKWNLDVGVSLNGVRNVSTGISNITRTESASGAIECGTDTTEIFIKSTNTLPCRIWINGTPVMKIDSSGNLTVTGNVTANGVV